MEAPGVTNQPLCIAPAAVTDRLNIFVFPPSLRGEGVSQPNGSNNNKEIIVII